MIKNYIKKISIKITELKKYYIVSTIEKIKQSKIFWLYINKRYILKLLVSLFGVYSRECSICGYVGLFRACGQPPRYDARCPSCGSLERQRLFVVMDKKYMFLSNVNKILHFAPEEIIKKYIYIKKDVKYISADLYSKADLKVDIEKMPFSDLSFDLIFCSHVLEHVNDKKAIKEIYRVLKKKGKLIAMIPICDGWAATYENPQITTEVEKELHFGQKDHVRYYGSDFEERLCSLGFEVKSYTGSPEDCIKYGLIRGEKIFVATK